MATYYVDPLTGKQESTMELFYFQSPFNAVFAGTSGSGKSHLVGEILKHRRQLIRPEINKIYWCYDEWQPLFASLGSSTELAGLLTFIKGLPTDELFSAAEGHTLVISDDMQGESSEKLLNKIFTKKTHHTNTSFIMCVQNLFLPSLKVATRNSQYLFLFKNPRDQLHISVLGTQILGKGKGGFLVDAYKDATVEPHSYLSINLRQEAVDRGRIRAKILPGELQTVYVIP